MHYSLGAAEDFRCFRVVSFEMFLWVFCFQPFTVAEGCWCWCGYVLETKKWLMVLTTFWCSGGTWQGLNYSSRLHSRALKMGSELESRCSRSSQGSTSTHRHSAAQQRLFSIRTHWVLCSPPPRFLVFLFFCSPSARPSLASCSRAFGRSGVVC